MGVLSVYPPYLDSWVSCRECERRAAPSEAAATKGRKGSKGGSRKRKAAAEWDDEQEEWPVEAIIDSRGATADDVAKYADVKKCGFGRCGELSNGLSFVMRRKL